MSGPVLSTRLQTLPVLEGISPLGLQLLSQEGKEHTCSAGQTLLMEDAWGNAVYLLLSGWVKVRRTFASTPTTLAILGSPCFFGEMAVLDQAPRATDVVCLSSVEVLVIPASLFSQLMQQEAKVCYRLAQTMAQRLRLANQRMSLRRQSAAIRFVHTLVDLGESFGQIADRGRTLFYIPLQDLADLAEVSLAEAQAIVDRFIKQGVIRIDSEAQVLHLVNYDKLADATRLL